jgi:hypothetical protein
MGRFKSPDGPSIIYHLHLFDKADGMGHLFTNMQKSLDSRPNKPIMDLGGCERCSHPSERRFIVQMTRQHFEALATLEDLERDAPVTLWADLLLWEMVRPLRLPVRDLMTYKGVRRSWQLEPVPR